MNTVKNLLVVWLVSLVSVAMKQSPHLTVLPFNGSSGKRKSVQLAQSASISFEPKRQRSSKVFSPYRGSSRDSRAARRWTTTAASRRC